MPPLSITLSELKEILNQGIYPIVFINLLPFTNIISVHAIIIVKLKQDKLEIIDPLEGEGVLDLTKFEKRWKMCRGLTI